jgi:uncharacterized protein
MTSDDAIRDANLTRMRQVMAAISRMDVQAAVACTHPGLVFELPFERSMPDLDQRGFAGLLRGLKDNFGTFTMDVVEVLPGQDPAVVVLRYEGDCLSHDGRVPYRNSYIAVMEFTDGLISRWREWDNPVISRKMNERLAAVQTGAGSAS